MRTPRCAPSSALGRCLPEAMQGSTRGTSAPHPGAPTGSQSPAFSLPPPALRYAGDRQAAGDVSQTPSEKEKSLLTAIGAGFLGPFPARGWVWDRMPGALCQQCVGTGWGGLCRHGDTSPICWKWGFGGRNCCCPHGPFSPSCKAKSWAERGCGAPLSPRLLPASLPPAHAPVPPPRPSSLRNKRPSCLRGARGRKVLMERKKKKKKIKVRGNHLRCAAPLTLRLLWPPVTCSSNVQRHSQAITHCTIFLFLQTINELFRHP